MHKTNLRKVGGSIMLAVPPALLEVLHLRAGSAVGVGVDDGKLIVHPEPPKKHTLHELLAQCNPSLEASEEEKQWLENAPIGRELL